MCPAHTHLSTREVCHKQQPSQKRSVQRGSPVTSLSSLSFWNEQSESSLVFNASLGTEVVERVVGTLVDQDLDVAMVCKYVEVPLFAREMPHSHPLSRTVATLSVLFFFFVFVFFILGGKGLLPSRQSVRSATHSSTFRPAHKKNDGLSSRRMRSS